MFSHEKRCVCVCVYVFCIFTAAWWYHWFCSPVSNQNGLNKANAHAVWPVDTGKRASLGGLTFYSIGIGRSIICSYMANATIVVSSIESSQIPFYWHKIDRLEKSWWKLYRLSLCYVDFDIDLYRQYWALCNFSKQIAQISSFHLFSNRNSTANHKTSSCHRMTVQFICRGWQEDNNYWSLIVERYEKKQQQHQFQRNTLKLKLFITSFKKSTITKMRGIKCFSKS